MGLKLRRFEAAHVKFFIRKRLDKFLRTANALISSLTRQGVYDTKYIEDIVVIDDHSSPGTDKNENYFQNLNLFSKSPTNEDMRHAKHDTLRPQHCPLTYQLCYDEDDWLGRK